MKTRILTVFVVAMLLLVGACAKNVYVVHPGAVDAVDSRMYDALLTWNGALTQAKADFAAGKLPPSSKALINNAGAAYNTMREVRNTYRAAKQAANEKDAAIQVARWDALKVNLVKMIDEIIRLSIGFSEARPATTVEAYASL